jgi:hypothetical protein
MAVDCVKKKPVANNGSWQSGNLMITDDCNQKDYFYFTVAESLPETE